MVGLKLAMAFFLAAAEGDGGGDAALDVAGGEEEERHGHETCNAAAQQSLEGVVDVGLGSFQKAGSTGKAQRAGRWSGRDQEFSTPVWLACRGATNRRPVESLDDILTS